MHKKKEKKKMNSTDGTISVGPPSSACPNNDSRRSDELRSRSCDDESRERFRSNDLLRSRSRLLSLPRSLLRK